ncbi:MAG: acyl-CoA dehydrogenase [Hyphomonas sp.]|uniref:acyl-CoA dehydrogenase family protein n=1 Tax=Hyphomonas sp. TaxID=87 RepID=UPI0018577EA7|nr:acyl-CoA dehydrogenase family protein [Hyphomonas sp.]MBA3067197.1 acyl-CoA dehydrogenase [Hyphomonas sp.]MBU4061193.1 acyl-CoA dehydrogenase family protein [Alphaproteobacteria bacterium]MBU4165105.1 acyl-CoA dehydrogenase family protein [Alphaproteobacteria bacterium]MBU4568848.1 acyl-CoA dehydrogenase family protein [Alphaproteobacteria bacterium]
MHFELEEDHRMLRDLVQRFVREELLPLEGAVLARDAAGEGAHLSASERARLDRVSKEMGLWSLDAPEEAGGMGLPHVALVAVNEALGSTAATYTLPPDSPNLRMLMATVNPRQKAAYLDPYARGETISAIGISEPGAGADPAGMTTRAVRDGDDWVINGRKIWISRAAEADFTILMAITDKAKGARGGMSAFLIDRDTPGFHVLRRIPMLGGEFTYEVVLEDCRVPGWKLLGKEGDGFGPMQIRLGTRRMEMAAWCIGAAQRALDMMREYAPQRRTFGAKLSERQAVQWWVADAAMKIHAARLMAYDCAWKIDQGQDVRSEISMIKVFAPEMAGEVIDHAMQCFGAMGMTKEMPLHLMAGRIRNMRIYDGPSEVHRMVVARNLMDTRP